MDKVIWEDFELKVIDDEHEIVRLHNQIARQERKEL